MSAGETYYRFESLNGCLSIALLPELNDKQWADIEKVGTEIVDRISAAASPKVLVDLSPLSYMGSAMVALIVRLYKTVNSRSGKMVVVNQHELVFEVLKLAGLTKLWTIVPNREEGFSSLGVKATAASGTPSISFQPGGMGLVAAGVIGTVGTLVGLALQFAPSQPIPQKYAMFIEVGFAFVGLGAGMFLLNQAGNRRNLGIAFLAICVLAVLGGIVAAPQGGAAKAPSSGGKATTNMETPEPRTTAPAASTPTTPVAAAAPVTPAAATPASAASTQTATASALARPGAFGVGKAK
ncbi:MAG TPA: STAS domain-containing protein [Planctomycetaceae bacterium]|nr:STAS domain-containing protein [Planctomycetaceae bacterium]